MRYEPFTPIAGISLSELKRRLDHDLEELIEDRPLDISRRQMALAIMAKAAAVFAEEAPACTSKEVEAPACAVGFERFGPTR